MGHEVSQSQPASNVSCVLYCPVLADLLCAALCVCLLHVSLCLSDWIESSS